MKQKWRLQGLFYLVFHVQSSPRFRLDQSQIIAVFYLVTAQRIGLAKLEIYRMN